MPSDLVGKIACKEPPKPALGRLVGFFEEPQMSLKSAVVVILVACFVLAVVAAPAKAQPAPRQPELTDQLDTLFDRASSIANQQKFYSILSFLLLGGASTYCVMRGIRKVVTIY
jgi:hypothetical protein